MKKALITVVGMAIFATGCNQTPVPTETPIAVTSPKGSGTDIEPNPEIVPDDDIRIRSDSLLKSREKEKFPYQEMSLKANGPVFVHLAYSSEEPAVVAQALQGMDQTYRVDKESDTKNLADASYDLAVIKNLTSADKTVLHYALKAAAKSLGKEPNSEVVNLLTEIASNHKDVGARLEALDALYHAEKYETNPEIMNVYLKALTDDAPIVSTALFRSNGRWPESDKANVLKGLLEGLLSHADPGVRGRAISVMADFYNSETDYILSKAEPLLKDKHPFVRSSALKALGMTKTPKAVHLMMTLVDDPQKNTYDMTYLNLLGQSETVHHDGSAWSRVNDAALYNIKSATFMLGEGKRFEYGKIDYKKVDEDISAQVKKAKSWYENYKKDNPPS